MQNVQALLTQLIRSESAALAQAARETGDKITWQPLDKGRSALNLVVECGWINRLTAELLETGELPFFEFSQFQQLVTEKDTAEKGLAFLTEATERCVKALEAFPTEKLNNTVTLPFGEGMVKTIAEVVGMTHWNMAYHHGQVNYIQTLYQEAPEE